MRIAPADTITQPSTRRAVRRSRMNIHPISTAKIELISRSADTMAIGR